VSSQTNFIDKYLAENRTAQRLTFTELEYNNRVNAIILDEHNAEITADEEASQIILYHGTRAPIDEILRQGLLIRAGLKGVDTKLQMIDEVLNREFGVTREQVPDHVWRWEYDYERTIEPHLHMSLNLGTAVGYSHQGCETKAQVRGSMYHWLLERRLGDFSPKQFEQTFGVGYGIVSRIACEQNGRDSHVVQVEVPVNFLRKEDFDLWRRHVQQLKTVQRYDRDVFDELRRTTMEMRCLKNVPPAMFRRVWKVEWGEAWGWIAGDYKLHELPSHRRCTSF